MSSVDVPDEPETIWVAMGAGNNHTTYHVDEDCYRLAAAKRKESRPYAQRPLRADVCGICGDAE